MGAPGFHRGAEIVHRNCLNALAILDRLPGLGQDSAGECPQHVADRFVGTQAKLVAHATVP